MRSWTRVLLSDETEMGDYRILAQISSVVNLKYKTALVRDYFIGGDAPCRISLQE
uniref:Uncharacterized protein n=1 Tax=Anguilla anguilla TaxID=7936 RepID=A0A0E9P8J9_ANGAN